MRQVEAFQQLDLFFVKASASMMFLLVLNVLDHRAELSMGVGKRTETFLPGESACNPAGAGKPDGFLTLQMWPYLSAESTTARLWCSILRSFPGREIRG
jgi:hypothetical protein